MTYSFLLHLDVGWEPSLVGLADGIKSPNCITQVLKADVVMKAIDLRVVAAEEAVLLLRFLVLC